MKTKSIIKTWKNMLVDQLIYEIIFLKDEIIHLRGDAKKKIDIINYLLLQKNGVNANTQYIHTTPLNTTPNNNVSSINSSFNSITNTTNTNELRVINEQRKLHINDNTKIPKVVNNTSNHILTDLNNDVIFVRDNYGIYQYFG